MDEKGWRGGGPERERRNDRFISHRARARKVEANITGKEYEISRDYIPRPEGKIIINREGWDLVLPHSRIAFADSELRAVNRTRTSSAAN